MDLGGAVGDQPSEADVATIAASARASGPVAAHQLVLRAAARYVDDHGLGALSMTDVAREAGISRSALYRQFPARHDLVVAVVADRLREVLHHAGAKLPSTGGRRSAALAEAVVVIVRGVMDDALGRRLVAPSNPGRADDLESAFHQSARLYIELWRMILDRFPGPEPPPDIDEDLERWLVLVRLVLSARMGRGENDDAAHRRTVEELVLPAFRSGGVRGAGRSAGAEGGQDEAVQQPTHV